MIAQILQILASAALAFGAWMGLYAMLKPQWISKTVGLKPREGHSEAPSEFRGTLGGLFFFSHLVTLILLWRLDPMSAPIITVPLCAAWGGAGIGRLISIFRDAGCNTRQNWIWVAFEWGLALAIGAPFLQFCFVIYTA